MCMCVSNETLYVYTCVSLCVCMCVSKEAVCVCTCVSKEAVCVCMCVSKQTLCVFVCQKKKRSCVHVDVCVKKDLTYVYVCVLLGDHPHTHTHTHTNTHTHQEIPDDIYPALNLTEYNDFHPANSHPSKRLQRTGKHSEKNSSIVTLLSNCTSVGGVGAASKTGAGPGGVAAAVRRLRFVETLRRRAMVRVYERRSPHAGAGGRAGGGAGAALACQKFSFQ
jgi:hypothetical protein